LLVDKVLPHAVSGWRIRKKQTGEDRFPAYHRPKSTRTGILVHPISHRVARYLERQSVLERDEEKATCNWMAWI